MEICSNDEELNKTFRNWLGPKNESSYDLCKRLYNGLTDRCAALHERSSQIASTKKRDGIRHNSIYELP